MIHQTAREYLLGDANHPFQINRDAAHEQLFLRCMRCLMSNGLRAKINRNTRPPFLDYSANSWFLHLSSIPSDLEHVFQTLHKFLAGHSVLTWIQTLAVEKQLRVLVQASRNLTKYISKRKIYVAARSENNQIIHQQFVESWATDLVKLVGKFGTNLRSNPEAIYKWIPPFCPQSSAIWQQFGKSESRTLLVFGLSSQNWDDSLARLSLGFGTYASSISAAGTQIAILAASGSVFVYDSSVFEQATASPFKHGERVYRMELNSSGILLVTYGFKTTKVWNISTGECKLTVQNFESRPRPLTMLLTNNSSTLLVGTDDRRVRSLDLTEPSPTWQLVAELEEPELEGHFLNSSSYMAPNRDGSLIAVAYRGHPLSAWEVDGPIHINHCWRTREEVARGEVIEAVWHPYSPVVFGLYIEGVIFKWNPYEGEPEEIATGASRLAMSGDGNLLATGDVHGTVKVYNTSELSLLYQLSSQDTVLGLAFSPDLRRFYDIRGYYGNAWEPNALVRYADQTRKSSETDSETESIVPSFMASSSASRRIDSITVLATSPNGRLYCSGTEYGTVRLFDTQSPHVSDLHVSKSFLSIEQMACSPDGQYVCFSDSSKKVYISSMTDPAPGVNRMKVEVPMKNITKGPILQLLFQPDSSNVVVCTPSTICTISLESASITQTQESPSGKCKWITQPHDPALILGFGPNTIKILDWSLTEKGRYRFEYSLFEDSQSEKPSASNLSVIERVIVTTDKKHILVQLSTSPSSKEKTFLYFATASLQPITASANQPEEPLKIIPTILPQQVTSQIALALSFLSRDRLVFLSRTFSICSRQIPSAPVASSRANSSHTAPSGLTNPMQRPQSLTAVPAKQPFKEIFALPGDWISREYLALCSVWGKEKSFLCPRNGEIAVVRAAGLV